MLPHDGKLINRPLPVKYKQKAVKEAAKGPQIEVNLNLATDHEQTFVEWR
jgi:hypothetical protein